MIKKISLLACILAVTFGEVIEGSGLVEGSGETLKVLKTTHFIEGSGADLPLLTEGSGEIMGNSIIEPTTTQETLSSQEIEILKDIRISELATVAPNATLESIDEEPLSHNIIEKWESKIENEMKPGNSWQRLEELLSEVISTELSKEIDEIEATTKISTISTTKTAKLCEKSAICRKDNDCGMKGKCMGALVGKCNCNSCFQAKICSNDKECGGLQGACRGGKCACAQVFSEHGLSLYIDVLLRFCNVKSCNSSDDCLGLSCNPGKCDCA
ncbi:unnamed protein product, partial [Mesorhabditis belari]|uniref:Uncharacterized protein n=1 Tax=Mesorhabditis belari TaxID=2138241 RepID=A0AAF3F182_9BILA